MQNLPYILLVLVLYEQRRLVLWHARAVQETRSKVMLQEREMKTGLSSTSGDTDVKCGTVCYLGEDI